MRWFVFLVFAPLAACTAVKATVHIVSAEQAVSRAKERQAPDLAPYEYTLALRYLEKAQEEAGYSKFRNATTLAKKSADWADQSIITIERHGVTAPGDDLPDALPVEQP